MLRKLLLIVAAGLLTSTPPLLATADAQFATSQEARAMLDKAVAALKADKTAALAMFLKGEGGFKDRDLYPYCANAGDGALTAHPTLMGKKQQDIVDKNGKKLGKEIRAVATEGKVVEVTYMWPRPGPDPTPVQKVTFVTKVGDQICAVGYYK